jgi:drug/metabolite transporter (DMT)-like permease
VKLNSNCCTGAKLASASEGSFLQPGITVFTAFLSVAFKYEKPNWWKALAVLGAVGGSLIILFARPISIDPNNSTHTAGLLCFVGQTFMWSLSVILQKPVLQRFPALTVIFWTMLVGGIINGAIGAYFASQLDWSAVSINALYSILYMILIGTVGAWQLNAFANQHLPPTITGMAICAQAILGAILGFVILGERITLQHVAGGVVIIGSVALIIYVRNMELRESEQQALTEKSEDSEAKIADVALTVQQVYVESAVESKPQVVSQPKTLPANSNKAPVIAKKAPTVVAKKTENPIAVEKVTAAPGELLMDAQGRISLA